jgi:ketosteroid isomerase-like protein
MPTTKDVLDHHLKSFYDNDLDGVLADYSPDAVLFVPGTPLKGPGSIKPFFQAFFSEFAKPGASFSLRQQFVEGDYAYILWSAETADNSYEAATDTFVVRNGKIVAQSFAAKIIPKRPKIVRHPAWSEQSCLL